MSYEKMRVYKCSACQKVEIGLKACLHGTAWHLPTGWTGELTRCGWCFCPKCSQKRLAIITKQAGE